MAALRAFMILTILPTLAFSFDPQLDIGFQVTQGTHFCLGCHDGTLGPNIINSLSGQFAGATPPGFCLQKGHPIEIDYRLAQIASRGRLRDLSLLDPVVKLENGMVGCTSCHSPDSQLEKKLVMSNAGSRLCFSCHNL